MMGVASIYLITASNSGWMRESWLFGLNILEARNTLRIEDLCRQFCSWVFGVFFQSSIPNAFAWYCWVKFCCYDLAQ